MSAPQPRRPKGKPLNWQSDDALDKAATVTPDDADAATQWWRRNAPAWAADLLDADEDEGR